MTVTLVSRVESRRGRAVTDGFDRRSRTTAAGFDAGASSGGMGLRNMQSRAAEVDGMVTITARPGAGTTVRASIPGVMAIGPATDEKWKPWQSNILPFATAILVGAIWRSAAVAAFGAAAASISCESG